MVGVDVRLQNPLDLQVLPPDGFDQPVRRTCRGPRGFRVEIQHAINRKDYFEQDELFGSKVATDFPSCERDIRKAGTCYALKRMRAFTTSIRAADRPYPRSVIAGTDAFVCRDLAGLRGRTRDVMRFRWNGNRTLP